MLLKHLRGEESTDNATNWKVVALTMKPNNQCCTSGLEHSAVAPQPVPRNLNKDKEADGKSTTAPPTTAQSARVVEYVNLTF